MFEVQGITEWALYKLHNKKLIDPEQTKEEYAKMGDPPLMRSHITGADWHSTVYTGLKGYDI